MLSILLISYFSFRNSFCKIHTLQINARSSGMLHCNCLVNTRNSAWTALT
jgi:hypothetical protein